METVIVIVTLVLILGGAAAYLVRAKKKGRKCVGCPHIGNCASCGSK